MYPIFPLHHTHPILSIQCFPSTLSTVALLSLFSILRDDPPNSTPHSTLQTPHRTLALYTPTLHIQDSTHATRDPPRTLYNPNSILLTLYKTHSTHLTLPNPHATHHCKCYSPQPTLSTLHTSHFSLQTLHSTLQTPHLTPSCTKRPTLHFTFDIPRSTT